MLEVLSLLLGIFGTIIGFYYGTGAQRTVASQGTPQASPAAATVIPGAASPAAATDSTGKPDTAAKQPAQRAPEPVSK